ncbi:hypothetical protein SAMN02745823_02544 [Sporobacter termitidis DSM 10068]|uniref:Uncharacterized protein n=1 Tax=Sporobacter termitidis DSM 10068 TaxID=1123282 RepID=A0A1M5YHK0_9FIRM|nr:hypothetical protein [Sporobacter termitidis]SHI11476.1 hypothetical protein SAMN02745823_02544 [Sporobacter termitidis DSM 10068]
MSLTPLNDDLNIIQALADTPNDTSGLTAAQLKAKFDQAGNTIKGYINDTLLPDVSSDITDAVAAAELQSGNMPAGGTTDQFMVKNSGSDYDYGWKSFYDLINLNPLGPVQLIQSYTTAGTYTFTAPDVNGDGTPYPLWALVDGAGGSGGAVAIKATGTGIVYASGAASGVRKCVSLIATPGSTYAVVVGVGGAPVTATHAATANATPTVTSGSAGGSSSFNGISTSGGTGGQALTTVQANDDIVGPPIGGQSADSAGGYSVIWASNLPAPAYGKLPVWNLYISSNAYWKFGLNKNTQAELLNPFDPAERLLSAGGAVYMSGSSLHLQSVETLTDGNGGGAGEGQYANTITSNSTLTGHNATSPGSGGGACGNSYTVSDATYTVTAISGAGADGQVRIYARKVVP